MATNWQKHKIRCLNCRHYKQIKYLGILGRIIASKTKRCKLGLPYKNPCSKHYCKFGIRR